MVFIEWFLVSIWRCCRFRELYALVWSVMPFYIIDMNWCSSFRIMKAQSCPRRWCTSHGSGRWRNSISQLTGYVTCNTTHVSGEGIHVKFAVLFIFCVHKQSLLSNFQSWINITCEAKKICFLGRTAEST